LDWLVYQPFGIVAYGTSSRQPVPLSLCMRSHLHSLVSHGPTNLQIADLL
jgi:hypothetical protein